MNILFISDGEMNIIKGNSVEKLVSQAAEKHKNNIKSIKERNEWKTSGTGAAFMGHQVYSMHTAESTYEITGITATKNECEILYSMNVDGTSGIHTKKALQRDSAEGYLLRTNNIRIFGADYNPKTKGIIASVTSTGFEKHLALFNYDNAQYDIITEGQSVDENPAWSKSETDIVYYNSCGIGRDKENRFSEYSERYILRLNLKTGDLDEIIAQKGFDCVKPKTDTNGNIYYIKRPIRAEKDESFKDFILAPIRIIRGIFGWLDFFTQRYSGESLKTGGSNPSKYKNEEELFIEGNLVKVQKNSDKNHMRGEELSVVIPKSWELCRLSSDGGHSVIKKGVLDFCIDDNNEIIYSTGNHIVKSVQGRDETIAKAHIATNLCVL